LNLRPSASTATCKLDSLQRCCCLLCTTILFDRCRIVACGCQPRVHADTGLKRELRFEADIHISEWQNVDKNPHLPKSLFLLWDSWFWEGLATKQKNVDKNHTPSTSFYISGPQQMFEDANKELCDWPG
jgi:hypothetical protein